MYGISSVDRWVRKGFIQSDGDCWIWTATRTANGYGVAVMGGRKWMAHRAVYTVMVGDIPTGLDLDHLCRVRACVNPDHLDPVTRSVNLLRGTTERTHNSRKTHCPHGHGYTPANTAIRRGHRFCRECDRARAQRVREARRGAH